MTVLGMRPQKLGESERGRAFPEGSEVLWPSEKPSPPSPKTQKTPQKALRRLLRGPSPSHFHPLLAADLRSDVARNSDRSPGPHLPAPIFEPGRPLM
eukprot:5374950-Pyramimonas_sp.AAC.1